MDRKYKDRLCASAGVGQRKRAAENIGHIVAGTSRISTLKVFINTETSQQIRAWGSTLNLLYWI